MNQRTSVLILAILLISYIPLVENDSETEYSQIDSLNKEYERNEISPNPNTMHSLSLVSTYFETEEIRNLRADTPIGIYTEMGLIPRASMNSELTTPRSDLLLVLIDGETGLWDARMEVMDHAQVEIRASIPPSGFLIQGTQDQLNKISNLSIVRASHLVPLGLLTDKQFYNLDGEDNVMVELLGWKDSDLIRHNSPGMNLPSSLPEVAHLWMNNYSSSRTGSYIGEVNSKDIGEILKYPAVSYISPIFELETFNNQARIHMGINVVENTYVTGLNGSGQRVAVADTGIDEDHGDFGDRIINVVNVAGDSSTADTNNGHGTHVACTVLGDGSRTSTYKGVAPEAELYFQAMEIDSTETLSNSGIYGMLNSAYNSGGARFHTNSWGSAVGGSYTTQSEDADERTSTWDQYWAYQGMTVLFAAGNEAENGISSPGTAKNVITIGGHQNRWDPDEMYPYSSRGPTDDGRIKPDLLGPGDWVRS